MWIIEPWSMCGVSLRGDTKIVSCSELFFSERAEEVDFILAGWLPLIVALKCALEMRLDVYIECLWL